MRTTLDLPDHLMQQVKRRAVEKNQRLKDTVAELLARGICVEQSTTVSGPVVLRGGPPPSAEEFEAMIAEGRE